MSQLEGIRCCLFFLNKNATRRVDVGMYRSRLTVGFADKVLCDSAISIEPLPMRVDAHTLRISCRFTFRPVRPRHLRSVFPFIPWLPALLAFLGISRCAIATQCSRCFQTNPDVTSASWNDDVIWRFSAKYQTKFALTPSSLALLTLWS